MQPERPIPVSVVVATYGRPDTLTRTLDSLVAQTLTPTDFEVIVVVNGPPGETPDLVTGYQRAHPDLDLRLLVTEKAGAAHARSLGVAAARGTYLTMIDDDDWVSPAYLERMLTAIRPGIVPLVDIADVIDGGEPTFANSYSERFRPYRGRVVPATTISPAMSFNVCKLIPTRTAREVGYDERLRSASDTLFWLRVYERTRAMLHVLDVDDAVYYRTTETGSLSRQEATYDFSVTRRLEAYQSLGEIPAEAPEVANLMLARTSASLARHMNAYLRQHPDQHGRVEDDARARGLDNVRWRRVNLMLAEELLVVGELVEPAFGDPLSSYRALAARGEVVDVLGTQAWADDTPWAPDFVRSRIGMRSRAVHHEDADPWRRLTLLLGRLEATTRWRADEGVAAYDCFRSHDPGGAAHLLAADQRASRTGTSWTVEVAEPLGDLDQGPRCPSGSPAAALLERLVRAVPGVSAATPVPRLGLEAAAALADRIEVISEPLREHVLATLAGSPSLQRAREVVVVEPPLPVPDWGRTPSSHGIDLESGRVHLVAPVAGPAPAEALGCLADALLDAPDLRGRLRLHLVGERPDDLAGAAYDVGLGDVVRVHAAPGLDALLDLFDAADAVLVLDGPHPDLCPPAYVPDAVASPTPAWLLASPGGLLAGMGAGTWRSRTGDPHAAGQVLSALAVGSSRH